MKKLSGFQRFQLAKLWLKRGREGLLEDFILAVCKAKDMEYVAPKRKK